MNESHTKEEILSHLEKMPVGVLATFSEDHQVIRLRVMYYGFDEQLNIYLMSTKDSPKVQQVISSHSVSLMVNGLEDPYDASWEVEINGEATLLETKKDILFALDTLKGINPFADVALESGEVDIFSFIRLKPSVVMFRIYHEALKGEPPTILKM